MRIRSLAAACALAALLPSCIAAMSQRVDDIRAKLIGVRARDLNRCVGVPFSVDEDGETEYLTYRWFEEDETDPIERPRFPGPASSSSRPGSRSPADLDADKPPRGIAYCELVFEVRGGRVRGVDVEGRRASGLNDDADCIRKAEGCIPREP